jgi:hypothetical protein
MVLARRPAAAQGTDPMRAKAASVRKPNPFLL